MLKGFIDKWKETIFSCVNGWDRIDLYTAIALALGMFGVVLNLICVRRASQEAAKLLEVSRTELTNHITRRLIRSDQPELLSGVSIRAMAFTVQESKSSPVITDPMIAELIRSIALDLETQYQGRALVRRLKILDKALREFEPHGLPLLSFAFNDRIFAYVLSALTLSLTVFFAQFLITSVSARFSILKIFVWMLPLLQILLLYSNLRASGFWKAQHSEAKHLLSRTLHQLNPKRLHLFIDHLVLQSLSTSHEVHTKWGPIWEELAFRAIPSWALPISGAWLAFQIGRYLDVGEDVLRSFVTTTAIALFILGLYISLFVFSKWHQYKYFEFKRLLKQFYSMRKRLVVARFRQTPPKTSDIDSFIAICRRLWLITGLTYYRDQEKHIQECSQDTTAKTIGSEVKYEYDQ